MVIARLQECKDRFAVSPFTHRSLRRLRVTLNSSRCWDRRCCSMAASAASRPRAINTRPIRGVLWRSVEGIPAAVKVGLKPGGEIHRAIVRRHADVAQVARAVTRGDIQTATKRDGEVREIAADAGPLLERLTGPSGGAGMLVTEGDMSMDENRRWPGMRFHPSGRLAEEVPRLFGTADRFRNIGFPKGTAGSRRAVRPPAFVLPAGRPDPAGPNPSQAHPRRAGVGPAAPRYGCTSCQTRRDRR